MTRRFSTIGPGSSAGFTPAGDLGGSSASQTVVALTGTGSAPNKTVAMNANIIAWALGLATPKITQDAPTSNAVPADFTVQAQSGWPSATGSVAVRAGATVRLLGGERSDTTGRRKGATLGISSTIDRLVEATEVQSENTSLSRVVSLCNVGSASPTFTNMPSGSGDGVICLFAATSRPTANPGTGFAVIYNSGGIPFARTAGGVDQSIVSSSVNAIFGSDADQTPAATVFTATTIISPAVSATLTATRNLIAPTTSGLMFWYANFSLGAQSVTVKTSAGTGVTVGNGKTAKVRCDGTNYVRMTADA